MPRHNGNTQPGTRRRTLPEEELAPRRQSTESMAIALVTSGRCSPSILDNPGSIIRATTRTTTTKENHR